MNTTCSDTQVPSELLSTAATIRAVEERLLALYDQGHLQGTVHTCVGQELVGASFAQALRPGDAVASNHRGHGHYLAKTDDVDGLIAEILGRATGVCAGMGGSQHLCRDGFLSNGIIGGMTPIAAGRALARLLDDPDGTDLSVVFLGDGSMSQGVIFETFNLAALLGLPLYVVCEANGMAQSTPVDTVQAGTFEGRAAAFGIETRRSTTDDPTQLFADISAGLARVRETRKPFFHVIETRRLNPHSKGDDTRPKATIEALREGDPLSILDREGDPDWIRAKEAAAKRVDIAVEAALAAPGAALPDAPSPVTLDPAPVWRPLDMPKGKLVERIREGLALAMDRDERVLILGEDVRDPYGGAFKATKGLTDRHPDRVFNMPITEAAIVGLGTGLAVDQWRPVVEIMFGDFILLTADQLINHASKFEVMYGGGVTVPLVVRAPMGGRRGYGPTHSQTLDRHLLGVPGLTLLSIHHRVETRLYADLPATVEGPVLMLENKDAYNQGSPPVEGYDYLLSDETYPTLLVRPTEGASATLLVHGGMLVEAERAAERLFMDHDILVEILCPTALYPFDASGLLESLSRTRRLVIAEEGQGFASFGAEAAALAATRLGSLQIDRVSPPASPIPCSFDAERAHMPGADAIVAAVLGQLGGKKAP